MKKIIAIVAAGAAMLFAVLGCAPVAMADGYAASVNVSANEDGTATVSVTLDEATYNAGYHFVGATVDDAHVSNVVPAAAKTYGWWEVDGATRTATFKLTTVDCAETTVTVMAATNAQGDGAIAVGSQTVKFPATCNGGPVGAPATPTEPETTAPTGAAVMPYIVAVVLLAAAGFALFVVRKNNAR